MSEVDLRQKFLDFFKSRGHNVFPSASLRPDETDPSVLFTTAGMHPLVPYLLGGTHPQGKRLASSQKCIRTDDIAEVGDKIHHTFFEMLGNWSLGDYFKVDAIKWSFEFLTSKEYLGIPVEKLAVSVFAGDSDAPFDQESFDIWVALGIHPTRIARLPKKNNWWGPAGETGPCGPDTEMFIWTGDGNGPSNFQDTEADIRWVEVWNDVFMQYEKVKDGDSYKFAKLKQHNVDTGMGLERALAVLSGTDDNYRTKLFWPIIVETEKLSGKKYEGNEKEFRVIADHIKAATFAIGDGAIPSNKSQGYIVRRLIRRAVVKAHQIGIEKDFAAQIAEKVFEIYDGVYNLDQKNIIVELEKEERKFREVLRSGLKFISSKDEYSRDDLFDLYQSHGIPLEIALEEIKRIHGSIKYTEKVECKVAFVDEEQIISDFSAKLKEHQDLSRTASAGMFKGGLADASEMTTKYHTATHLLQAALRQVLGSDIYQKGSNITALRMRFDFSYPDKMTPEQVKQVEDIVNDKIAEDLPVQMTEMTVAEAKSAGALGVFESKYGDKVKVYSIGDFSKEICGGPHVEHTGELGHFKITKEESSSSGVRRIKAVLE